MKDDMISRQAAIKTAHLPVIDDASYEVVRVDDILALPSATDTNVATTDTISRQAAIKTMMAAKTVDPSIVGCASNAGVDWCIDAIKALPSAQPDVPDTNVGDMISRQAAIELFKDDIAAVNELNNLPSLPPAQPGWIPCTPETMPKMTDTYLVKVGINENGEGMHTEVRTADWNKVYKTWNVHESEKSIVGEVTAWMSSPTPYREGGLDEQN